MWATETFWHSTSQDHMVSLYNPSKPKEIKLPLILHPVLSVIVGSWGKLYRKDIRFTASVCMVILYDLYIVWYPFRQN